MLCGSLEPAGLQTRREIITLEMGRGDAGVLRGGSGARLGGGGVKEGFLEEVMAKSSEISTVEYRRKVKEAANEGAQMQNSTHGDPHAW